MFFKEKDCGQGLASLYDGLARLKVTVLNSIEEKMPGKGGQARQVRCIYGSEMGPSLLVQVVEVISKEGIELVLGEGEQ